MVVVKFSLIKGKVSKLEENKKNEIVYKRRDGIYKEYHKNSNLKIKANIKNGEYDGEYKQFNNRGKIVIYKIYENNKLNGYYFIRYPLYYTNENYEDSEDSDTVDSDDSGNSDDSEKSDESDESAVPDFELPEPIEVNNITCIETTFKNGNIDGEFTVYYADESKHVLNYKNGKIDGQCIRYYCIDEIMEITTYKDGILHGDYKAYSGDEYSDEDPYVGLILEYKYKNGEIDGVYKKWYENGSKKEFAIYDNGEFNGLRMRWYENGQLKYSGFYEHGKKIGLHKTWYENGQKKSKQKFKKEGNTILMGELKEYDENGHKIK